MLTEDRISIVKDLRPIDDVFFEVIAEDTETCQEILSTILEFPKFSARVKELKTTEGGASAVCEVMDKYINEEIVKDHILIIQNMQKAGLTIDQIKASGFTDEEIDKALAVTTE